MICFLGILNKSQPLAKRYEENLRFLSPQHGHLAWPEAKVRLDASDDLQLIALASLRHEKPKSKQCVLGGFLDVIIVEVILWYLTTSFAVRKDKLNDSYVLIRYCICLGDILSKWNLCTGHVFLLLCITSKCFRNAQSYFQHDLSKSRFQNCPRLLAWHWLQPVAYVGLSGSRRKSLVLVVWQGRSKRFMLGPVR